MIQRLIGLFIPRNTAMPTMDIPDAIARSLFERAADLAFNSIMVTQATDDAGGSTIIYVNDGFTEMTGYAPDEVIGETPGMLQGPKTERSELDRLDAKMQAGEPFHGETINYRKDGSEFIIEWKVAPIVHDGGITHYVSVQRDVTALRAAEQAEGTAASTS
jgi:PAS domain S-box-containing protein